MMLVSALRHVLCNRVLLFGKLDWQMWYLSLNNIQVPTLTLVFNTFNPGNVDKRPKGSLRLTPANIINNQ